jgi:peptide-methionine (R)-S-oxide reductase
MNYTRVLAAVIVLFAGMWTPDAAAQVQPKKADSSAAKERVSVEKVVKSDAEWRKQLSPEEYEVTRKKGTERPFTGRYWNTTQKGIYLCVGCGAELFSSETKFDAGCGWPSFWDTLEKKHVRVQVDSAHGMVRSEIVCDRCDAHLGHVFEDGPPPTGLRYCLNSVSLKFVPAK